MITRHEELRDKIIEILKEARAEGLLLWVVPSADGAQVISDVDDGCFDQWRKEQSTH